MDGNREDRMESKVCQRCGKAETVYDAVNWRRSSTRPNAPFEFCCNTCLCGCLQCQQMTRYAFNKQ